MPLGERVGIVQEVANGFRTGLRMPLDGYALFQGKETVLGHWGIEEYKWYEAGEMADIGMSMDIPPVRADSINITPKTVESPILFKDYHVGGRKMKQLREAGFDPVVAERLGRVMAVETLSYLLFGSGTGKPGPDTGVLNNADAPTPITGGNWGPSNTNQAKTINKDLAAGVRALLDQGARGPFALVMGTGESDLFEVYVGETNRRFSEGLPGAITRVIYENSVADGDAYLVPINRGYYDVIRPRDEDGLRFGLGNATTLPVDQDGNPIEAGTFLRKEDSFMMNVTIRNMNILIPRVLEPKAASIRVDYSNT